MFVMLLIAGCETGRRGGVPERSNGAVLKTVEPHGSVSSNLTPAALSGTWISTPRRFSGPSGQGLSVLVFELPWGGRVRVRLDGGTADDLD